MTTDKFVSIGYASEAIGPGQEVEYCKLTRHIRRRREYDTFVTKNEDGTISEKRVARQKDDQEET